MTRRILGGLLIAALASAGCGGEDRALQTPISGDQLTVYASVPLRGPLAGVARDLIRAEKLALSEAGGRAGAFQVSFVALDSADPRTGRWSPALVAANAREAIRDRQTIAYLGELETGASAVSVPILNESGILQLSPRDTFGGLTEPGARGEPERFYPSGVRTFGRLVPSDAEQAAALVRAMRSAGVRRLAVADDGRVAGTSLGDRVARLATAAGVEVVLRRGLDPGAAAPDGLGRAVAGERADAFLISGVGGAFGAGVLREVHRAAPRMRLFGADDLLLEPGLARRVGAAGRRLLVTAIRPLPSAGDAGFERRFAAAYGRRPDPRAVLGYDAMRLVLRSVVRVGARATSRRAVVREALGAAREPRAGFAGVTVRGTRLVTVRPQM